MSYSLKYTLDIEAKKNGFTKEDVEGQEDVGLCDAIIVTSIINYDNGSYSELFLSKDGHTGEELTARDFFKHFCMLAFKLESSTELLDWQKFVVIFFTDLLRKTIEKQKDNE